MSFSLHEITVPACRQILTALSGVLEKAQAHCAATGTDPATLISARLVGDMAPFPFQVSQTIAHSVGALARLRGQDPARPDAIDSFAAGQAAIAEALRALDAITPADLEGAETRKVVLTFPGRSMRFDGKGYLLTFALPQFYFHATTAYDLLRHHGVPIGKRDFLGQTAIRA